MGGWWQFGVRERIYRCVANRYRIKTAIKMWQMDHPNKLFRVRKSQELHEALKEYLPDSVFQCPSDPEGEFDYMMTSGGEIKCSQKGVFHRSITGG